MRQLISRRALPAAVVSLLALPAGAGAATLCAPLGHGGLCDAAYATPQQAVDAADAAPGADVVALAAGTFDVGSDGLTVAAADTAVRGAGRDQTILTTSPLPDDGSTRRVVQGRFSHLSDLTVRLASAVTSGPATMEGIDAYDAAVVRVTVDAVGATFGPGADDGQGQGILLRRGLLQDVEIDFDPDADADALRVGGAATLSGVTITARNGLSSDPETDDPGAPVLVTADRLRITAQRPLVVGDGSFTLSDALLRALPADDGDAPAAVSVHSGRAPDPAALTLDRVTVVGSGQTGSAALAIGGNPGPVATRLTARHVIAWGFPVSVRQESWGGDLATEISYSLLDTSAAAIVDATDPAVTARRTLDLSEGNRSGDPLFLDAGAGDFHVRGGSPAAAIGGRALLDGIGRDLDGKDRIDHEPYAGAFVPDLLDPPDPTPRCDCFPPPPPPRIPPQCFCGPGPDTIAPQLSGLALVTRRPRRGAATRPVAFRFTLSERASVRIAIERRVPAIRARRGRGAVPARWVAAGALRPVALNAGAVSIAFGGRLGSGALKPGAYRATVVATDAAANRSAPARVRFSVARAVARGRARPR
ncbi:hypothetical protein VSS74_15805 [Conexibacter stalactiti]|uniref:Uncharacterized protein n=1 Tax=Conexibacter stalactiti TaxID=1940611 RepID=A0ABU4HRA2_9ACTN|nr:hypothetical protein [Conexibacter stalactiti]MDW5595813.1 hypothetical protein [Conexibacter stalactiti]MEC5036455.1 hypothetical protein [Conexibacter stalactiti]